MYLHLRTYIVDNRHIYKYTIDVDTRLVRKGRKGQRNRPSLNKKQVRERTDYEVRVTRLPSRIALSQYKYTVRNGPVSLPSQIGRLPRERDDQRREPWSRNPLQERGLSLGILSILLRSIDLKHVQSILSFSSPS